MVAILVERDMKLRYKRSTIGLAWSMLNPLLQFAVFYLVFRFILPVGRENYGLFLFIGLLAWGWFQNSLQIGCSAIVDHASLSPSARIRAVRPSTRDGAFESASFPDCPADCVYCQLRSQVSCLSH